MSVAVWQWCVAIGLTALWALSKAARDSSAFYPTSAWVPLKWPRFWGKDNWRWVYVDGIPERGYRYPWWLQNLQTPFRSGWHLAEAIGTLSALALPVVLLHGPWWLPVAGWVSLYVAFSVVWPMFRPAKLRRNR